MKKNSKIYVAGHRGLVGSAIMRLLQKEGYINIVTKNHKDLDLLDQVAVNSFFEKEKPEYVFLAAAKVGGILANRDYPAEFIYKNLQIQNNIIQKSHEIGVKKLLFLGSSCIYPKECPQPIKEEYLLSGYLESTNDAYAIAKIAGLKMCDAYARQYGDNFIAVMPTNLYGPNDNFDLESSHVLPALIGRFHDAKINNAKSVTVWGTGTPKREFLHVDDLANACIFLMNKYNEKEFINIGTGVDITIKELAETVKLVVGFDGDIVWDTSKPDGTMRKVLDISKIAGIGWRAQIGFEKGVKDTYKWFLENNM